MEQKKEVERKRKKIKEEFYPFLLKISNNVEDSKVFCAAVTIGMKQMFNKGMTIKKVSDLDLLGALDEKNERFDQYKTIIEMFKDETIADAVSMIDGMSQAIDSFIREENTKRPLKELKATFL